jgi:hypothetical protein
MSNNLDERLEALTMNLELAHRDIQLLIENFQLLRELAQRDGENIRGLARIAEIHEHRLTELEGGKS